MKKLLALALTFCMMLTLLVPAVGAVDEVIATPKQIRIEIENESEILMTTKTGRDYYFCHDENIVDRKGQMTFRAYNENNVEITQYIVWSSSDTAKLSFEGNVGTVHSAAVSGYDPVTVTATFSKTGLNGFEAGRDLYLFRKLSLRKSIVSQDGLQLVGDGTPVTWGSGTGDQSFIIADDYGAYNDVDALEVTSSKGVVPSINAPGWTAYISGSAYFPGLNTITITQKGHPDNTVTLQIPVVGVAVSTPKGNVGSATISLGKTTQLVATTATKDDNFKAYSTDAESDEDLADVTWSSSDETIATVDENGMVTPLKEGKVVIKAVDNYAGSSGSNAGQIELTVTDSLPVISSAGLIAVGTKTSETNKNVYDTEANAAKAGTAGRYKTSNLMNGNEVVMTNAIVFGAAEYEKTVYCAGPKTAGFQFAVVYDESLYSAVMTYNGKAVSDFTSSKTVEIEKPLAGDNKFALTLTSKEDPTLTRTYTYNFYVAVSASSIKDELKMSAVTLTSPDRSLNTTMTVNGQQEGKTFGRSGATFNTTLSGKTELYSFVYRDIQNVSVEVKGNDPLYGHLAYSLTKDGELLNKTIGVMSIDNLSFAEGSDTITLYIHAVSAYNYLEAEKAGEDPWSEAGKVTVIPYVIRRLAYTSDTFGVKNVTLSDGTISTVAGSKAFGMLASGAKSTELYLELLKTNAEDTVNVYKEASAGSTKEDSPFTLTDGIYSFEYPLSASKTTQELYMMIQANVAIPELEKELPLRINYTVTLYQQPKTALTPTENLPTSLTGYLCIASVHTNDSNKVAPSFSRGTGAERTLFGYQKPTFVYSDGPYGWMVENNETTLVSLGNFGGYVTYYFADGIRNDSKNPNGVDFVIYGYANPNEKDNALTRNAAVYVSKDGSTWYELAGSEHYDSYATWNYSITYQDNGSGTSYTDNQSGSGSYPYPYPTGANYTTVSGSSMTFSGTRLGTTDVVDAAWGYAGLRKASGISTPNPYTATGDGNGFDLDWAVDENGLPVSLDSVNYVKVVANNLLSTTQKSDDDKSPVIGGIAKVTPSEATDASSGNVTIKINGETVSFSKDSNLAEIELKDKGFTVSALAEDGATVYINNQKTDSRTYSDADPFDFSKGIVRIVVQKGSAEPEIFYLKLTLNKGTIVLYTGNVRGDVDVYAQVKAVKDAYEAEGYKVLLLDAGNYLQGTTYANSDRGLGIYNLMDAAGYDAAAMGLAEFGYGDATTGYLYHSNFTRYFTQKELQEGADAIEYKQNYAGTVMASRDAKAAAGFKALASNVTANNSYYSFTDSAIFTLNGKTIAVYGISNPEIAKNVQDDLITEISAAVKPENLTADYVICLSNASVSGSAYGDIVIDASGDEMIVGAYLIGDDGTITKEDVTLSEDHKDATVSALAEEIKAGAKKVIGTSDVILNGADSVGWNQETNLGDLVTDALTWYAKKYVTGISENQPVVAVQNGGNCDNFLYSGDITETDLLKAFPFSPMGIGAIEITGAQLLRVLETSTQSENCPGFAQVSGLRYALDKYETYDAGEVYGKFYKANSDNRVAVISVDGQPIDMDKTYTLVCDNYLIKGNDTYYTLKELVDSGAKYINDNASGRKVRDVVAMYIQEVLNGKIGSEYAQPQDRIVLLSQQEHDEIVSVNDPIALIGDEITLDSKDAIEAAESAYQALSDVQKLYVDKLSDLENARKAYDALVGHTHNYGEGVVTKESVNGEAGIRTYTCTVCGETKEEEFFVYHIVSGANQSVTVGKDATFTTDMATSKLIRVEIDGKTVDASNYTVSASSEGTAKTAVTFKGSFLKTLKLGSHTLKLVGIDAEVEATFNMASAATPTTGDNGNAALYLTLMLLSVAAALVLLTLYRKRKVSYFS